MHLADPIISGYTWQMLKTIIEFVNTMLLDAGKHRWIKRLIGPLLPDIAFLDVVNPQTKTPLRFFLALQDMKGPSFHLLNRRQDGFDDYEKSLRSDILKYLPEDGVFFDVGANVGIIAFSTAMHRPRARVFAFEPEPVSFLALSKTKALNSVHNVDLLPVGLGEASGLKTFFIDKANYGGHSLDRAQVINDAYPSSILVSTVDTVAQMTGITRMDVMKIDVQGLELEVLKGALQTIAKFHPVLTVEFTFNDKLDAAFIDFFKSLPGNYQFAEPGDSALKNIDELSHVIQKRKAMGYFYGDFFFVPAQRR